MVAEEEEEGEQEAQEEKEEGQKEQEEGEGHLYFGEVTEAPENEGIFAETGEFLHDDGGSLQGPASQTEAANAALPERGAKAVSRAVVPATPKMVEWGAEEETFYDVGWVKDVHPAKGFSTAECPGSGYDQDVVVSSTVAEPLVTLNVGDTVAFAIHVGPNGTPEAADPVWKLGGGIIEGEPLTFGEYAGVVSATLREGSAFVNSPEVRKALGCNAYISRHMVEQCGLCQGDIIAFHVHVDGRGLPNVKWPCWKCCAPSPEPANTLTPSPFARPPMDAVAQQEPWRGSIRSPVGTQHARHLGERRGSTANVAPRPGVVTWQPTPVAPPSGPSMPRRVVRSEAAAASNALGLDPALAPACARWAGEDEVEAEGQKVCEVGTRPRPSKSARQHSAQPRRPAGSVRPV